MLEANGVKVIDVNATKQKSNVTLDVIPVWLEKIHKLEKRYLLLKTFKEIRVK